MNMYSCGLGYHLVFITVLRPDSESPQSVTGWSQMLPAISSQYQGECSTSFEKAEWVTVYGISQPRPPTDRT